MKGMKGKIIKDFEQGRFIYALNSKIYYAFVVSGIPKIYGKVLSEGEFGSDFFSSARLLSYSGWKVVTVPGPGYRNYEFTIDGNEKLPVIEDLSSSSSSGAPRAKSVKASEQYRGYYIKKLPHGKTQRGQVWVAALSPLDNEESYEDSEIAEFARKSKDELMAKIDEYTEEMKNPSYWTEPELEEHRLKWKEVRRQKMQLPLICLVYTKTDGVMTIYSSFEDYDKAQTAAKNLSKKVSDVVGVESTHDSVSGGFAHFQGGKPVKRPRGHDYLYPVDDLRSVKQQGSMPLPEKLLERKRNPFIVDVAKSIADEVVDAVNSSDFKYFGIRSSGGHFKVGQTIIRNSVREIDGEKGTKKLRGVSVVGLGSYYPISVVDFLKAAEVLSTYNHPENNSILLLGSDKAFEGEDPKELELVKPVVLKLFPGGKMRNPRYQPGESSSFPEKLLEKKRNPLNPSSWREMLSTRRMDDASVRLWEMFERFTKPDSSQVAEIVRVSDVIARLDGKEQPTARHYAEAQQYATRGVEIIGAVAGLKEAAQDMEPAHRGGGLSPTAKRARKILAEMGMELNPSPKYFYIQGRDDARAGNKARSLAEFEQRYASQVRETSWAMPNDLYREYLNGAADAVQDIPSQGGSERVAEIMREFRAKGGRAENPAAIRRQEHGFHVSIYEGTYSGRKEISFSAFSVAEGFSNTFNATAKEEAKGSNTYYVEVEGGYDTRGVAGMGWASARKTIVANNLSKRDAKAKLEELWRGFLQGDRVKNPYTDPQRLRSSDTVQFLNPSRWMSKPYTRDKVKHVDVHVYDLLPGDVLNTLSHGRITVTGVRFTPDRKYADIDFVTDGGKESSTRRTTNGLTSIEAQSSKEKRNPLDWYEMGYSVGTQDWRSKNVGLDTGDPNDVIRDWFTEQISRAKAFDKITAKEEAKFKTQFAQGYWDGLIQKRTPKNRRRNPESSSASVYEEFHGKPSESVLDIEFEEHEHEHLAALGTLVQIVIITPFKKEAELNAPDPNESPVEDHVLLCSNEEKTQLYLVGGDQSLNDEFLEKLGFKQDKNDFKDFMVLGLLKEVTYRTEKGFDKFKSIDYYHELGEETGMVPVLIYDYRSGLLRIAGGQYEIKDVGIVN